MTAQAVPMAAAAATPIRIPFFAFDILFISSAPSLLHSFDLITVLKLIFPTILKII